MADNFIFDLGEISVSENVITSPLFDGPSEVEIQGDVLLQYEWKRLTAVGSDADNAGAGTGVNKQPGTQGDWFNCFLFNVDATDISDVNAEDIEYHTVKANWCGHSITRALYDRWQKPGNPAGGPLGDADVSGATSASGVKGTVTFTSASDVANQGNFNAAETSQITGYLHGTNGSDTVADAATHLNLAGEYMRYYSAKMFGGRLRYGLDIFSNEAELIDEVRALDVSLNNAVQAHLTTSNDLGVSTIDERHDSKNIPHVILSQLLSDPDGADRVRMTLSKPANAADKGTLAEDNTAGDGKSPSRTVDVDGVTGTVQAALGAGATVPTGANFWYRIPLKDGDKLRIKVVINDARSELPAGAANSDVHPPRTYIIEYLLKD